MHVVDSQDMYKSSKNSVKLLKLYKNSTINRILVLNKVDYEENQVPNIIWKNVYKYFPQDINARK